MKCFFGMLAVGTEDGHLYLIDMRADDNGEDCSFIPLNTLLIIDPSNGGDAAKMREKARLYGQYCCVDLTSMFYLASFMHFMFWLNSLSGLKQQFRVFHFWFLVFRVV